MSKSEPGRNHDRGHGVQFSPLRYAAFLTVEHFWPVTKADIIDRIATGTGLTKIETEAVVNGLITTLIDALKEGDGVELRGFGSFRVQHRKARKARNPQTNEELRIGPRYVPVFRPSKDLRRQVDQSIKAKKGSSKRST